MNHMHTRDMASRLMMHKIGLLQNIDNDIKILKAKDQRYSVFMFVYICIVHSAANAHTFAKVFLFVDL